jgi:hypothetical protein
VCGIAKLNSKGAAAMSLDLLFISQIQNTADWRREKAEQFADDTRNLEAAKELDTLAAEIEKLESSKISRQICELIERTHPDDGFQFLEDVSAQLRSIGFHCSFTGMEFLVWYRDLLQEKLCDRLDSAVPTPTLDELVANDPAVKESKKAYEAAYAKALTEARKRL